MVTAIIRTNSMNVSNDYDDGHPPRRSLDTRTRKSVRGRSRFRTYEPLACKAQPVRVWTSPEVS